MIHVYLHLFLVRIVCILVENNPCRPCRDQVSASPGATPLFPVAVAPDESGPSKSVSRLLHLHFSVPLADLRLHLFNLSPPLETIDYAPRQPLVILVWYLQSPSNRLRHENTIIRTAGDSLNHKDSGCWNSVNQGPKGERKKQDDPPDFDSINILATTSDWIYQPNKELDIGSIIETLSPRHIFINVVRKQLERHSDSKPRPSAPEQSPAIET